MAQLKGTQTQKNLLTAFAGEYCNLNGLWEY